MFPNGSDAANSLGMANGSTRELAKAAARAVRKERIQMPAAGVLAILSSGLVSIHLDVIRDGGSVLMNVAMKV